MLTKNSYANMSVEQKKATLNALQKIQKSNVTKKIIIILTIIETIVSLLYIFCGDAISYTVGSNAIVSIKFKDLSEISNSAVSMLSIIYIPFLVLTIANACGLYFIMKYPLGDKKNIYVNYLSLASIGTSLLLFIGAVIAMDYPNSISTFFYKTVPLATPILCCIFIMTLKIIPSILHYMYISRDKLMKNIQADLSK